MTKTNNISAPTTFAQRLNLRLGKTGSKGLVKGLFLLMLVVVGLLDYLLVFFLAVSAVPNMMAAVQQGTGVNSTMAMEVVVAGWIVPSLFIVGMMFVLALLVMRSVWRVASKLHRKISVALLGTEAAEVVVSPKLVTKAVQPLGKAKKAS